MTVKEKLLQEETRLLTVRANARYELDPIYADAHRMNKAERKAWKKRNHQYFIDLRYEIEETQKKLEIVRCKLRLLS